MQQATKHWPHQGSFTFTYNKTDIWPQKITWSNNECLLNGNREIVTARGFILFYDCYDKADLHFAIKFVSQKYKCAALREVRFCTELQPLNFIDDENHNLLPIVHASVNESKTHIMLISRAIGLDLINIDIDSSSKNKKKLKTYQETINLLQCISQALVYLHSLNFVYSDIKRENIVTDLSSKDKFYLIDFDTIQKANKDGNVFNIYGTEGLKSQGRLQFNGASISDDIWCLSIVLYEFITGEECCYNHKYDFSVKKFIDCLHLISQKTSHWTKFQQRKIKKLFRDMNQYASRDRITISNLPKAISYQK